MDSVLNKMLENASYIYTMANESFKFSKYFHTSNNEDEQKIIMRPSIRFIQHTMWRTSIIELDKLFNHSNDQHFSFYKILNAIEKDREVIFGENLDCNEILRNWRELLKTHKTQISQTKKLRNKIYAHTDTDRIDILKEIDLSYEHVEQLLSLSFILLKDINEKLFDRCFLDNTIFFRNPQIIEILAEYHSKKREQRISDILKK
ncbi:hypothetical protein D1631_05840 [Chryseobacterium nematophagum]|uniref:HEPN AbiU2-like domain-containing protein n=1 Tax=Chryseobacterium nematophagum TaxID=2305228 RepID=A0A3M7TES9_9FLAO|nr:hypothetical protein [Chryseobacterium nematophagum]RNA61486.1 hypothetical protein D1631_05840 [Chryseobacterium nematophagum]